MPAGFALARGGYHLLDFVNNFNFCAMISNKNKKPDPAPAPTLGAAVAQFIESNDCQEVKDNLFTLLHYAMASSNADHLSAFERDHLFFHVNQLNKLLDAMYQGKEGKHV